MAAEVIHIVSGEFKGTFHTDQKAVLGSIHEIVRTAPHTVVIHEGTLWGAVQHELEETAVHPGDFHFQRVRNIQIHPGEQWPYPHPRIFALGEMVLYDAKISEVSFLNGKTYGKITARTIATVVRAVRVSSEEPQEGTKTAPTIWLRVIESSNQPPQ
jgi:hypothetical protein